MQRKKVNGAISKRRRKHRRRASFNDTRPLFIVYRSIVRRPPLPASRYSNRICKRSTRERPISFSKQANVLEKELILPFQRRSPEDLFASVECLNLDHVVFSLIWSFISSNSSLITRNFYGEGDVRSNFHLLVEFLLSQRIMKQFTKISTAILSRISTRHHS